MTSATAARNRWHLRSSLLFLAFALLFLVGTIVFAILFGIERNKTRDLQHIADQSNDVCMTPYCIKAANDLLESMDETVDPCEDMYQFACGSWLEKTVIPTEASNHDTLAILQKSLILNIAGLLSSPLNGTQQLKSTINARQLYNSCLSEDLIDVDAVDTLLSFVNTELGGWPILQGSAWNESTFDFARLLLRLNEQSNQFIFAMGTMIDEKNSSMEGIRIAQSDLSLRDRSYYLQDNPMTEAYQLLIFQLARALNNDTPVDPADVTAIFQFEKQLAFYHWTPAQQNLRNSETIATPLATLTTRLNTTFNFADHLRRLYLAGNVTLLDTDIVTVSELEFLRNASQIIDRTSARTVQNYMVWRFVINHVKYLPKRFRAIKQQFDRVFDGTTSELSRELACATEVNGQMGFAVAKLYVDKYFDRSARSESLEMIGTIREIFISMVNQSSWMDSQSKLKALDKAQAIDEKVGYPSYLDSSNSTKLDEEYAEYQFNSSYIRNSLLVLKLKAKGNLAKLRRPVDRKAWTEISPTVVNAFYNPSFNDISFPAGILQPPFFHKDAPKYLNYGAIGLVIGHEITHGFDDFGRQYDKEGNRVPWWSNATIEAFNKRKACIIEQYSNYTSAQAQLEVRGQQTQGEDIADNGGLREAFLAYRKWSQTHKNVDKKLPGLGKYSAEQMFFLSSGRIWCAKMTDQFARIAILTDVHSPPRFRVIGSTSNSPEFSEVFGCKPGQGNSRVNKCAVW